MVRDEIPSVIMVENDVKQSKIEVMFLSNSIGETLFFGFLVKGKTYTISVRAEDIEKLIKRERTKKEVK